MFFSIITMIRSSSGRHGGYIKGYWNTKMRIVMVRPRNIKYLNSNFSIEKIWREYFFHLLWPNFYEIDRTYIFFLRVGLLERNFEYLKKFIYQNLAVLLNSEQDRPIWPNQLQDSPNDVQQINFWIAINFGSGNIFRAWQVADLSSE